MTDLDELWDALRESSCSTKEWKEAKAIVMLNKQDVKKALQLLKHKSQHDCPACKVIKDCGDISTSVVANPPKAKRTPKPPVT
jgi:hypothetical protein